MKGKWFTILISCLALFFISGCSLFTEDPVCGIGRTWESSLGPTPVSERLEFLTNSRVFIFEDYTTPENICTEEHTSADFYIELEDGLEFPAGWKATGVALWGPSFQKTILLSPGGFGNSMGDIGLKQFFKGEPGWISLQIIVEFPTQGSLEKDLKYFHDYVENLEINYYYKEHI